MSTGGSCAVEHTPQAVLGAIEHTRLKADTTPKDIEQLCREAVENGFGGVCVNPMYVPQVSKFLAGSPVAVVTVVGFPLGASSLRADCAEAEWTIEQGAREVDMVIPIGLALSGDYAAVARHVAGVRKATQGAVLKVILECGFFDTEALRNVCRAAAEAAPDYLKTATGFGPRGATVDDVTLLSEVATRSSSTMRVKASGGVRSLADARRLMAAGAARLGTSSGVAIARELSE